MKQEKWRFQKKNFWDKMNVCNDIIGDDKKCSHRNVATLFI